MIGSIRFFCYPILGYMYVFINHDMGVVSVCLPPQQCLFICYVHSMPSIRTGICARQSHMLISSKDKAELQILRALLLLPGCRENTLMYCSWKQCDT